jgi:hypothetical protein
LKAIRSLPARDQDAVLAFLLDRALLPDRSSARPADVAMPSSLPLGRGRSGFPPWQYWVGSLVLGRLAEGRTVVQLAAELAVEEDAVRAALNDLAARPHIPDRLAAIFRLLAAGHSAAQAATELGLSEPELAQQLEPSDWLASALCAALSARAALLAPPSVYFGGGGQGALRTMPVRFPEEQYQRLKDWCSEHNFPMAVVVRGVVERFLEDQQRRAA